MLIFLKFRTKQWAVVLCFWALGLLIGWRISAFQDLDALLVLTFFILVIDTYPIKIGRLNISFSFPLMYAMILTTGALGAGLLSAMVLLIVQTANRQTVQTILFNAFARVTLVIVSCYAVNWLSPLFSGQPGQFPYEFAQMFATHLIFEFLSVLVFMWYTKLRAFDKQYRPYIVRMIFTDMSVSLTYTSLMLYLSTHEQINELGLLGIVYFFLPLAAISFISYLLNTLDQVKKSLITLFEVSQSITQQHRVPTVLEQVIERAVSMVKGHCGVLYLMEEGELRRKVCTCPSEVTSSMLPRDKSIALAVAESGVAEMLNDVVRDPRFWPGETQPGTRSLLVVPIVIDDKVAGVISLGKRDSYSFVGRELQLMEIFASHAGVAMKNMLYMAEREKRLLVEERNRLAHEIHDGIAQDLASAIFQLEMMRRQNGMEAQAEGLFQLQEMLRQTATTLRHSIFSLRPAPYTHVGLGLAMRAYLDEVERTHGLQVHFEAPELNAQLKQDVTSAIYQVFSESLQNVIKHAEASEVWVQFRKEGHCVTLLIRDNGKGFHFGLAMLEAVKRHSFGIENLHVLADQIGGSLEYTTSPGRGTEIMLNIPLKEDE